jgi:hypothetical protein
LISPARLFTAADPRVQGHLDVLEDRLLLENEHVAEHTTNFLADRDWFSSGSWQYQCGLERHANIHLLAGDAPNFIRSMLNQYASGIVPGECPSWKIRTPSGWRAPLRRHGWRMASASF